MQWEGFGELVLQLWEALEVCQLLVEMRAVVRRQMELELVVLDDVLIYQ